MKQFILLLLVSITLVSATSATPLSKRQMLRNLLRSLDSNESGPQSGGTSGPSPPSADSSGPGSSSASSGQQQTGGGQQQTGGGQQQPAGGRQQQPAGGRQQQPAGGRQQQPAGGRQQQPAGGQQQQQRRRTLQMLERALEGPPTVEDLADRLNKIEAGIAERDLVELQAIDAIAEELLHWACGAREGLRLEEAHLHQAMEGGDDGQEQAVQIVARALLKRMHGGDLQRGLQRVGAGAGEERLSDALGEGHGHVPLMAKVCKFLHHMKEHDRPEGGESGPDEPSSMQQEP